MNAYQCDACKKLYVINVEEYPNYFPQNPNKKIDRSISPTGFRLTVQTRDVLGTTFDLCPICMRKVYDIFKQEEKANDSDN